MSNEPRRLMLVLVAVLVSVYGQAQAAFTDMVVIGDSLSDQGNVFILSGNNIPPPAYTDGVNFGRFTNGLNYIDYLSSSLGISAVPSLAGGSNYATGGARMDSASIGPVTLPAIFSLLGQRDAYIDSLGPAGTADPDALHVVWGGSNDLTDIIEGVIGGVITDPLPALEATLNNLVGIIDSLAAADAKTLLVPNIPNLGLVPLITDTNGGLPVAGATELAALFNLGLADAIDGLAALYPDTSFFEFDAFSLLTDAYFDPVAYGFTNVTDGCYSLLVLPGGTTCANPEEYLSWDGFHPTTRAHELLAANVVIPLPAAAWLFGSGLFSLILITRRRQLKEPV